MSEYYVHGIEVSLTSNWPGFLKLVALNYGCFREPGDVVESLAVEVELKKRRWWSPLVGQEAQLESDEKRWGSGISRRGQAAILSSEPFRVEFTAGEEAKVRARYEMDRKSRIYGLVGRAPSWEHCQRMMRLALHKPLFHLLEQRGAVLIHAAALAKEGEAILIAGLNGSGKSTLCFNLLDRYDYMSDNFVLFDGNEVLGFPEAMRLPASMFKKARGPVIYGKRLFPVDEEKTVVRGRPKALIVLTRSAQTSIAQLSPEESARRLNQIHDITHEFPRYGYLGTLSHADDRTLLRKLTDSVENFSLKMSDVSAARREILEIL